MIRLSALLTHHAQVLRRRPALARLDVRREHAEALLTHLPDDYLFWERDDGRVGGRRRRRGVRRGALQLGARALPGAGGRRRGAVGGRQGRHVVVVAVNNEVLLLTFGSFVDGVRSVGKTLASSKKVPVAQWGSACAARGSLGETAQHGDHHSATDTATTDGE